MQVLVSGLGLMGGSLAAALSAAGCTVLLHHRRPEVAREAASRGWGRAIDDLAELDPACELAVVGGPVDVIPSQVQAILAQASPLCTDMGSTKAGICRQLAGRPEFIGSHPMCGSHLQGLAHADADLFRGAVVVVCPSPDQDPTRIARIEALWRLVGARPCRLDAASHDRLVAEASHLPHLLACLTARRLSPAALPLAAGGFRDTSRVAAASPELWSRILLENATALEPVLATAAADLEGLRRALHDHDPVALELWLGEARERRQAFEQR